MENEKKREILNLVSESLSDVMLGVCTHNAFRIAQEHGNPKLVVYYSIAAASIFMEFAVPKWKTPFEFMEAVALTLELIEQFKKDGEEK